MISPAPGCISRRFRSAVGLETPSHSVILSRWRLANEYAVGSVFSKYPEVTRTPCAICFYAGAADFVGAGPHLPGAERFGASSGFNPVTPVSGTAEQSLFYIAAPGILPQLGRKSVQPSPQ